MHKTCPTVISAHARSFPPLRSRGKAASIAAGRTGPTGYNSGFTEWMETTQVKNQRSVFF